MQTKSFIVPIAFLAASLSLEARSDHVRIVQTN